MRGKLIIISSPSGGGKGTLIREILQTVPNLGYSVSHTTRGPRFGEEEGRDYHFVSSAEFRASIESDAFLEYAEVHGNFYGTSKGQIEKIVSEGRDAILEIDVQGALSVLEKVPDSLSIFILPPSFEVLRARLTARNTEDAAGLALRLKNAYGEVMQYSRFDYVVINDQLTSAIRSLGSIICAERQRRDRQTEPIQAILDSFAKAKETTAGE
ncbi:MAG TPA: guanylate kinase [Blastocatellia bacterium]|nr:guanylate kinase [Blastocatellia bacterium]